MPVLLSRDRPVPLIEGVLDRHGTFQYRDVDGMTKTDALLPPHCIPMRTAKPSSQDVIVPLARKLVDAGEKLIIFRNQRGKAQGCARYLSNELGRDAATATLDALPSHDLTSASHDLRECLRGGTAFHSTNLLRMEREAIERGFRDPVGGIWVLGSTTTLAAGINTPASTVILAEQEFRGEDGRPFTIAEYKNMAGRAGRLGFNETGKAIILADTPVDRARLFQRYVEGTPEDVTSSFTESALPTWVLRLLSQVRGVKAVEIPSLLVNTFGGYAAARANPNWVAMVEPRVTNFVDRLLHAGLAEKEGDDIVHLTMLGHAVGGSSLSFESGLRLVELLRNTNLATTPPLHILALVQVLQEMSDVYTPIVTRGRAEAARVNDLIVRYDHAMSRVLQRYGADEHELWRRCKRAAILFDWVEGVPVDSLERRYTANPYAGAIRYGDIVSIADATRFHLRSAHRILAALFPEQPAFLEAVDVLLTRLEFGLPERALPLRKLPIALTRGQCLAHLGCRGPDTGGCFCDDRRATYRLRWPDDVSAPSFPIHQRGSGRIARTVGSIGQMWRIIRSDEFPPLRRVAARIPASRQRHLKPTVYGDGTRRAHKLRVASQKATFDVARLVAESFRLVSASLVSCSPDAIKSGRFRSEIEVAFRTPQN